MHRNQYPQVKAQSGKGMSARQRPHGHPWPTESNGGRDRCFFLRPWLGEVGGVMPCWLFGKKFPNGHIHAFIADLLTGPWSAENRARRALGWRCHDSWSGMSENPRRPHRGEGCASRRAAWRPVVVLEEPARKAGPIESGSHHGTLQGCPGIGPIQKIDGLGSELPLVNELRPRARWVGLPA